ncbi:MAG: SigE family RNA polymerase sigma factor [Acidimicrobiia bacterium]|nr:SigE family RNA polymerase sigma factor [Acidimicrobiia bacterium]
MIDEMGADSLVAGHGAAFVAAPTVGALEDFDRFYAREFPKMVNVAYALSGSRMAAEDLAQEAMIAAYRRWDEVGRLERPGGWARRVVLNRAASAYHRRKAEARALLRLAPLRGGTPAPLSEDTAGFWRAVRRLPRRQAEAIALHYLEDASVAEIATVMGCAENTVKVHLHRGRNALCAMLGLEE